MAQTAHDSLTAYDVDPDGLRGSDRADDGGLLAAQAAVPRRSEWHGPLESIVLRPKLFFLPIVLMVAAALGAAFTTPPVYSAQSQLVVGSVVRDFQSTDGQVLAIQQLTDIYSRLVGSEGHMKKVDAALGETVPSSAIAAAPIPNSALIRLTATGASKDEAVARAQAGAEQLVTYIEELRASASSTSDALLNEVNAASAAATAASAAADAAKSAVAAAAGTAGLPAAQQAYAQAQASYDTAKLRFDALQQNYTTVKTSNSGGIGVNMFAPAAPIGSDRKATLQLYGIGAILIGGLLGMALATLSANHWRLLPMSEEPEPAA